MQQFSTKLMRGPLVNVRKISLSDEKTFLLPQGNLEMDSFII